MTGRPISLHIHRDLMAAVRLRPIALSVPSLGRPIVVIEDPRAAIAAKRLVHGGGRVQVNVGVIRTGLTTHVTVAPAHPPTDGAAVSHRWRVAEQVDDYPRNVCKSRTSEPEVGRAALLGVAAVRRAGHADTKRERQGEARTVMSRGGCEATSARSCVTGTTGSIPIGRSAGAGVWVPARACGSCEFMLLFAGGLGR